MPPKLAAKILRWEYIEMAEMLPEFWSGPKSDADAVEWILKEEGIATVFHYLDAGSMR